MATIFIPLSTMANAPTKKLARELVSTFPQVTGWTRYDGIHQDANGQTRPPGFDVHTSNDPEPDEAAIVAFVTTHDGSEDPAPFGVAIPLVQAEADLPAQPPDLPANQARLAATRNPQALWAYAAGAWRQL